MNNEEWRPLRGFPDYQVSNHSRVMSNKFGRSKILKQTKTNKGYMKVTCYLAGKKHTVPVHRIVADAFIPNPEGKLEVNHIDENRSNNSLSNLEWATRKENHNHSSYKLRGEFSGMAKLTEKDVLVIRELLDGGVSQTAIAENYGVSRRTIYDIKEGKTWGSA